MNAITKSPDTPLPSASVALVPKTMDQAVRLAEMMARGKLLPDHLRNSAGDCLMVVEQAMRWRMSPFAVAQCTSSIKGKLMFEGKLVAAAVESSGALVGGFDYQFSGEGQSRKIVVSATRLGEKAPRTVEVVLRDAVTNNDVWKRQPDQQLVYHGTRVWARRWTPAVMLGVYSPDEFDAQSAPQKAFEGMTVEGNAVEAAPPDAPSAPTHAEPEHATVAAARAWCETNSEKFTQRRFLDALRNELDNAATIPEIDAVVQRADTEKARNTFVNGNHEALMEILDRALVRTRDMSATPADDFPGVVTPREPADPDSVLPHSPLDDLRALMVSCHSIAALDATMRGETWKAALADLVEHERDMLREEISKRQQQLRGTKS